MIRFNSFLHRIALADIIRRWMVDRLEPNDVRSLKELINFNCHIAKYLADDIASYIFGELAPAPVASFGVRTKGVLKDFMVDNPRYSNPRIEQLVRQYRKYPQDFYRQTPFDAIVYFTQVDSQVRLLGSTRRKRFRRVAEKSARRIIDFVFGQIKDEAQALARERAGRMGVPIDRLITPLEQQREEFLHAERRIVKRLRTGQFVKDEVLLDINDVVGVKAICEDDEVSRLTALLSAHPRMEIIEYELHSGAYNALNLTVRYVLDKDVLLSRPPSGERLRVLESRGMSAKDLLTGYDRFIREGEDDVVLEVIVAGFEEGLESEIGRSMHEERVLAQRSDQQYRGSLARNIVALLEYMMALRHYPPDSIDQIPIKLWIKYMPDYFESLMKASYGVQESVHFGDADLSDEEHRSLLRESMLPPVPVLLQTEP